MKLRLQTLGSPSPSAAFETRGPVVHLGRDPGCEMAFADSDGNRAVSWKHARIELSPGGAYLTDLGSSNGTFVNDVRLSRPTPLKARDVIRLGLSGPELRVVEVELSEVRPPAPPRERRGAVGGLPRPPKLPPRKEPAAKPLPPARRLLAAVQRRQRPVLLGAGAGAILLVVAAGGLWWRQSHLARPEGFAAKSPSEDPAPSTTTPPAASSDPAAATNGPSDGGAGGASRPNSNPAQSPSQNQEPPAVPAPAPAATGPAAQAQAVLKNYCFRCHGENGVKESGVDVLDREKLVARKKVVPSDPAKSRLLKKMQNGEMPPPDEVTDPKQRPTPDDIAVVQRWIQDGAPAFPTAAVETPRRFISPKDMLTAIRDYLRLKVKVEDRPFQRFYTLTHLYNNPRVKPENLPLYRAALSKLINSLSWEEAMVLPAPVDREGTIYAVDLRRLSWDRDLWQQVLAVYPYGLTYDLDPDDRVRDLANEVASLAGTPLPYLRADWFVANASRPPLYHTLLRLPDSAADLERILDVDLGRNFETNHLVRAGFAKSNVSNNNRMVERHEARYGAYWRSYDFKSNVRTSNLFKFPLGPVFARNEFVRKELAFQQAGGELIWSLPNGLHAYLLIDAQDKRIDKGPPDVVSDLSQSSGTTEIVTGLSCMGCHKQGMISDGWKDEVRSSRTVSDEALLKVRQLYPEKEEMDRLLKHDETRFLEALNLAVGSYLKVGADQNKDIRDFTTEPTTFIAKLHLKSDVGPEEAAFELGIRDPKVLQEAIRTNSTLREALGLGPLAEGNRIKREAWESLKEQGFSPFQQAAQELRLGRPFRPAVAEQPHTVTAPAPAAPERRRPARPMTPPAGMHPADLPRG
jgi:serine/threonine-protein kinase